LSDSQLETDDLKPRLISRKNIWFFIGFILADLIAVGAGMGVPFFAILLGLVVGWLAPMIYKDLMPQVSQWLRRSIIVAILTSAFTMLMMVILWGPSLKMLWDPTSDFVNFGIPMILYEPKASFIGWMVLMILISPVLQFLVTAVTSALRIAWFKPKIKPEIENK
jgi:hypothetical protein